ncbi:carbohydrate ABC transporter permease [Paenibacillus barengoltzii]|uniref:Carbohydrate ABC transporter membrane protein 1, CUT1 family (TC 3.A.1.1.-) n=1 Tax=Paenibacillus barengoltzii J12 TaxID=935846 RepID=A0ABY1LU44_9BACL|nr:sugar ABC transporter permease [Paenibacillus barengoltzii]SMF03848.1 carbohydrate ABC transporter membrane protein 1, CUT1 family (TC 3.A.1.1.-) [Paenibacillus barengoltzii J12]
MNAQTVVNSKPRKRLGLRLWPYLFSLPFVLLYLAFQFYPVIYSFFLSFHEWNGVSEKRFVGFANYVTLFTKDPLFYKSIFNTVVIMLMSLPTLVLTGMLLAYLIFNMVKGRMLFQTANFLPYITTPVAIGFIFSFMFDWQTGIINALFVKMGLLQEGIYWLQDPWLARIIIAIMIVWRNLGYFIAIYLAGMTAISQDVYEAAKVDGATAFHTFTRITLPLLRNISVFLIVTSIIGSLQLFDEPKLLYGGWTASQVGGPDNAALTIIWKFVNDSFMNVRFGYGATIAYALFMLIVVFSIASYKLSMGKGDQE